MQVGTPVQSYTRLKPRGTPCVDRRVEATDLAWERAWFVCSDVGAEGAGVGVGFDLGRRAVSIGVECDCLLRVVDKEAAIASRDASMSATTILVKGWFVERAEERRRPIAPAPKTKAAVGSETDVEIETSSDVGGFERWIAWMQTARGSMRAPCVKEMDSGSL
jgi:hypothetical protein